jgi:hypothetical protein
LPGISWDTGGVSFDKRFIKCDKIEGNFILPTENQRKIVASIYTGAEDSG